MFSLIFSKKELPVVTALSEKPDVPHYEFSGVFLWLSPWKLGQGHQNLISSLLSSHYIPVKICESPTTGSQDIMQTRKCDADANANTDSNAEANGICTKNSMSSSP